MNNQEIGHCKDCDKWKQGKRRNNADWYSDEGFCNNWFTITILQNRKEKQNES